MKSYGGFLPIELQEHNEYYNYKQMVRVNSARSGIALAAQLEKCEKIIIPAYLCESVYSHLLKYNIPTELYNIDESFSPIIDEATVRKINDGRVLILITNYYGIIDSNRMLSMVKRFGNAIIDNTQAFFNDPIVGVYNVYSCRKFFGVSDGGYIIGGKCCREVEEKIPESFSSEGAEFLLSSYELGTDHVYGDFLQYESKITQQGICRMSKLTKGLLRSIDYEAIKTVRKRNFRYLCDRLNKINELCIPITVEYPMVYPLLINHESLRETLVKQRVFVPQWWKHCLNKNYTNIFEKRLSTYLIPIPIDQRYSIEDMDHIVECIVSGIY